MLGEEFFKKLNRSWKIKKNLTDIQERDLNLLYTFVSEHKFNLKLITYLGEEMRRYLDKELLVTLTNGFIYDLSPISANIIANGKFFIVNKKLYSIISNITNEWSLSEGEKNRDPKNMGQHDINDLVEYVNINKWNIQELLSIADNMAMFFDEQLTLYICETYLNEICPFLYDLTQSTGYKILSEEW